MPRSVAPIFRSSGTSATQTVGARGGTIMAVAADGTRFVLTVPAGALQADTVLTMEPVAVNGELGLPVTLPFAVKMGPSGTQFFGGAELAITLHAGSAANASHAYVMEDSGLLMSLAFSKVSGQTITFQLHHLTTPGVYHQMGNATVSFDLPANVIGLHF